MGVEFMTGHGIVGHYFLTLMTPSPYHLVHAAASGLPRMREDFGSAKRMNPSWSGPIWCK